MRPVMTRWAHARCAGAPAQVRQQFRPEFINRIDEFIVFQALDKSQIMQIVRLQVRARDAAAAAAAAVFINV